MRRLFFMCFTAIGLIFPQASVAQFIGYAAPQTITVQLANNVSCTGSAQNYDAGIVAGFNNIGQTVHFLVLTAGSNLGGVKATIAGSNDVTVPATHFVTISDTLTQVNGGIVGQGYYAQLRVTVICQTGTYSLNYTGTSIPPTQAYASNLAQLVDKNVMIAQPAGTNFTTGNYFSPYGSSSGALVAVYASGAGPAGSTLTVTCITQASTPNGVTFGPFTLAATTAVQSFPINATACPNFNVAYVAGGASANSVSVDYTFNPPGFPAASSAVIGSVTQGTTPWITQATTGATILSNQQAVTNSATALASNALAHGICVEALSTNTASVFIGPSGVTTSTGIELPPKSSVCLGVSNSNAVFVVAAAGGSSVTWAGN